jgi:hypothetical protein
VRVRAVLALAGLIGAALSGLPAAADTGPGLSVDVSADRHAISPGVYGVSYPTPALLSAARIPLARWGGNATTRYNWRNNTTSTASDWYFENVVRPPGESLDAFVTDAQRSGARPVVTVPVAGWVAKDSPVDHPFTCGFPVDVYGPQHDTDAWDQNCGNGEDVTGKPLSGDPARTSIPAGPAFVGEMVQHLVSSHGAGGSYQLDNEPSLWGSTHRDIHPGATTYDEITTRSVAVAAAVRAADPGGSISGPGDWGWCAYFYSAADNCQDGPDRQAHGGADQAAAYLAAFAAHDRQSGTRTLDVFDEHWYPQAAGVALAPAGDAATQALRLRQTRTLWDPSYTDESWTGDLGLGPVMLLPRMKKWVATHYPGTGIAVGEYNFGGLESINGALAQADVLGILGREGVAWAALWAPPQATEPGAFAFRMFRNLDGAGAAFGDVSVRARSGDQSRLAVYAAQRTSDAAVTLVVVNKTGASLTSPVTLAGAPMAQSAQVFTYSAADPSHVVRASDVTPAGGSLSVTFPATSITTLVLPSASGPPPVGVRAAVSATTVAYGAAVMLSARTLSGSSPAPSAPAELWSRPRGGGDWTQLAAGVSDDTGLVQWSVRPAAHTDYVVRSRGTSSEVLAVLVRRTATLARTPAAARVGSLVTFRGGIRPAASGQRLALQRLVGGTWRTVAAPLTNAAGTWSAPVRQTVRGHASYRVSVPGDPGHLAALSAVQVVQVG